MEEAYFFLSSKTPSVYAQSNRSNAFYVRFDTTLTLEQNNSYEIGLLTLTCSPNHYNITDGSFSYYSYSLSSTMHSRIPSGRYTVDQFIHAFMSSITEPSTYELSFAPEVRKFKIHMSKANGSSVEPELILSSNLKKLTGFENSLSGSGNFFSTSECSLNAGDNHMFVYSSIIENNFVNTAKLPILATVPYTPTSDSELYVYNAAHVLYMPLVTKYLQGIDILIKNREHLAFQLPEDSETTVLLHLRPLITHI